MGAIIKIWNTYISPASDKLLDLGSSTLRFKNLYLSGLILTIQTGTTYTILTTDDIVLLNHATDDVVVTLPAATGSGKVYYIKNINTGVVTVDGASSDKIDNDTDILLANRYDSIIIADCAANTWYILVDNR